MTTKEQQPFADKSLVDEKRVFASLTLDIAYYQALLDEEDIPED